MATEDRDTESDLAPTSPTSSTSGFGDLIAGVRSEGRAVGGSIRNAASAFKTGLGDLFGAGGSGDPQAPGPSNNGADGRVILYGSQGNPTAAQRAAGYGFAPQDQQQQQDQQDQQDQQQQAPASTFDPVGAFKPKPTPDGGQASGTFTNSGKPIGEAKPDPAAGGYVPNRAVARLTREGFGPDQPLKAGGILGALGLSDVAVGLGNLTNPAAVRDAIDKRNAIYQNAVAADEAERKSFLQGIGTRVQAGDWSALADAARIDPQGYQQLMSAQPMQAGFAGHLAELKTASEYLGKVLNGNLDPARAASSAIAAHPELSAEDQQHIRSLFGMTRAQMASMAPVLRDAIIQGNAYTIAQNKAALQTGGNTWLPATPDLKASAPSTKVVTSTAAPGVAVNVAGPIMMRPDQQSASIDGRRYLDPSAYWVTKGDEHTGQKWEELRQQAGGFVNSPEARQVVALNAALSQYPDAGSFNALGANARTAILGAFGAAGLKTESEVSAVSGIPTKIAAKLVGGVALSNEEFGTLQAMAENRLHQAASTADPARSALITDLARQGVSPADAASFIPDLGQGIYASDAEGKGADAIAWDAGQQQRKKWSKDFAKQYPEGYVEIFNMKGDKPRAAPADPNDLDAFLSSRQQGAATAGGAPTGGAPGPQSFAPAGGPGGSPGLAAIDRNMGPAGGVAPIGAASVAPVAALAQARMPYQQELQDPAVAARLLAITHAEVGGQGPDAQRAFMESVLNRAAARGQTLAKTLSGSYFPEVTYQRAAAVSGNAKKLAAYEPALRDVMAGSNVSNFATGNASGSVGFAGGPRVSSYNGENFGIEGSDAKWSERMRATTPDTIAAGPSPTVDRKALPPLRSGLAPGEDQNEQQRQRNRQAWARQTAEARRGGDQPAPAASPAPIGAGSTPWGNATADAFAAAGPANMPSSASSTPINPENREAADAFVRSGANAVTFGQADRLAGFLNRNLGTNSRGGNTVEEQVRASDEAARANPGATAAGGVAGTVAQNALLPGSAFATSARTIGASAALGAADVAGQKANRGADLTSREALKDIGLGAAIGAGSGALAPVIGRAVGSGVAGGMAAGAAVGGLADTASEVAHGQYPTLGGAAEHALFGAATGGVGGAAGRVGARANEARLGLAPNAERVAASTLRDADVSDFRTLERLAAAKDPGALAAIEKNGLSLAVVSQAAQAELAARGVASGTLPPEAQTLGAVQAATGREAPARIMSPGGEAATTAASDALTGYGAGLKQRAAAAYAELEGRQGATFSTPASAIFQAPIAPELAGIGEPRLNNSLRSPAGPAFMSSTLADDVRRSLTLANYTEGRFPSVDHAVKAIDAQIGREGGATTYGQIEGLRSDLSEVLRDATGPEKRFLGKALDAFDARVEAGIRSQFPDAIAGPDGRPTTRGDAIVQQIRDARLSHKVAVTAFGDEKPSRDLVEAIGTPRGASTVADTVLEADPRAVPRFVAKLAASPDARMSAPEVVKAIHAKANAVFNDSTAPAELRQAARAVPDALRTAFVAEHFAPNGEALPPAELSKRMATLESREYAPIRKALGLDGKAMEELRTLHLLATSGARVADLPADTRARAQKVLDDFMPGTNIGKSTGAEVVDAVIGRLVSHAPVVHRVLATLAERNAAARAATVATPASVIADANRARNADAAGGFGEYAGRRVAPVLSHALVGVMVPQTSPDTSEPRAPYKPKRFVPAGGQAASSGGAAGGAAGAAPAPTYKPRHFVPGASPSTPTQ